ncbi:protein transport protein Sec31B isoform X1 [Chiroxiphia lanceolata]|uniref:protein transport protein Sec31B isoform X1 n=1 Tax=Chiroxiphia lanceolata TaxID=296741 RepID=UPI0013CED741|nr:protein transport protein Sec31B isoform X1 [Chiroxiphia lanceolata]XP_032550504.1 protein transport protein Sec31B isoform X1 [Chiroxiphia lanceolata]XP_032550505.1 protein transport protein Sec31B isoform X1 [Chiroxiphia lanceolata]XP_032550506.1 protein transport protein Sec31B isoform X1 [Chiroxiphia lanceolata]XP_032550507.1 protein transport protein Sec31B isoform X1 [Chiroxiphia lanceolata]
MKLKEIERTAVQAWSPANNHPIYLATGTSAQQLDASFSTNATLEIFEVDFRDPSLDMKQKGTLPASNRFHKLIWGNFGNGSPESSGVVIGGGDNGVLTMYSVHRILSSKSEPVIGQTEKHSGPVRALDFNPFQSNLLASGANDSEIFIWDLNNFSVPMTPGTKSQPHEDISVVSWNRQVQHILSSAHPSGKAVVWDLRKNEPIIKVSDHSNRMHCSGMAWHPEVATQLVLSSEDDRLPVIQIWDLRFATSPLSQLEGHTRGVLSVSWCQADPELLLSSAKDNRILCWNPSMGEVVYELPIRSQWCFDVQWCPRNPSVFSAATFDGWINIYSVMGGNLEAQQKTQADKISSSFNNLDPFGTGQSLPPLQVPEQVTQTTLIPPLKKPPKWIRRPVGVSFAFGGKLITFGLTKAPGQQMQQTYPHQVFISQVTTETEFLLRSKELQMALQSGNLLDYCQGKIQTAKLPFDENLWNFLKVNLEQDSRTKLLKLLGYSKEDLQKKIASCLSNGIPDKQPLPEADDTNAAQPDQLLMNSSNDVAAVSSSSAFFDNLIPQNMSTLEIPVTEDTDGLISQALLLGNFEGAVELCMRAERFADAIILAIAGGENLLKETQRRYFAKQKTNLSLLLSSIVQQNWQDIVCTCDLQSWKEALAILLTYSKHEDYTQLCDMLGARLELEGDGTLSNDACLCYISSGNVERLVECWVKNHETSSPLALQDLIEKVMVLSRSIEMLRGTAGPAPGPVLAERITQYANLLASQGCLAAAMNYLPSTSKELLIEQLRDRLFHAQGENVGDQQPPPFPYTRVNVGVIKHSSPAAKGGSALEGAAHKTGPRHPEKPNYQSSFAPSAPSQPSVPSLFTPQPVPAMSVTPHHIATPQASTGPQTSVYSRGHPYPQYNLGLNPATVSGPVVSQSQPFGPVGVRPAGPAPFPSQPPLPGQSMPMTSPGVPPPRPALFTPASVPSSQLPAACPLPVASQSPLDFSSAPFNSPLNMGYPQGGPGAPSTKPLPAAIPPPPTGFFPWLDPHMDHAAQESWSDHSTGRGGLQKKKLPEKFTPPAPITAPVMGLPTEPQAIHPQLSRLQESGQSPPGAPREGSLQYHQLPVESVEKKELPPEHQALKATFEGLVQRCSAVATDPKTRRKLEDALQRLECLYDKLREQALSPTILMGLHEIARCIEAKNYPQGLLVHTQVVSSSSFSEVSGFMPILKVLMTIAGKLNV